MFGVNFKRIDNGPQCQIDNFDYYCQKNFQKNLKISHFFVVIYNILKFKKNIVGVSAWSICRGMPHIYLQTSSGARNRHLFPNPSGYPSKVLMKQALCETLCIFVKVGSVHTFILYSIYRYPTITNSP